ncbi:MAG: hypothetical protein HUU20_01195 [Pirellulales bacterium]|nr:hypothetical protein [Pirellulales bacterium]
MSPRAGKPATICAILLSLVWAPAAIGQDTANPMVESLHVRAFQFLEKVAQDQPEIAYQDLLRDSPLMKQFDQSDALKKLVEKTKDLQVKYGECRKIERVAVKKAGENLVVLRYLYECEYFPVVWHFAFYRTPSRDNLPTPVDQPWRLITVRFDTEPEKAAE